MARTVAGTTSSALSVTNAASGLTLTDGTAITLSLVGGQMIGTVGADAANPSLSGKVAFAIALDPLTGQVYVAQYLSLHQDSATNTPNDLLSLAAGSVAVTVTLTDGDGDQVSSAADISTHINFLDDGPTAPTVTVSAATVGVDETPAVQTTGGASDVLGSTAIKFNGAATTVAGLFAGVLNKGTDPDVPAASLDNGALSFASSGASSIVTVTGGAFGADGPGHDELCAECDQCGVWPDPDRRHGDHAVAGRRSDHRHGGYRCGQSRADRQGGVCDCARSADGPGLCGAVSVAAPGQPTNTPNDLLSLAAGSVGGDGDADRRRRRPGQLDGGDISTHINFLDDGPTAPTVTVSAATVGVDETPAVQTIAGGASDVLGSTAITFNGARDHGCGAVCGRCQQGHRSRCSRCFAGQWRAELCLERGEQHRDGDGRRLWRGRSGRPTSSALSVTNAASGLTLTDGTAITLSLVDGQVIGTVGAVRPIRA